MDPASVSVVVPSFDAGDSLRAALASADAQTLKPLEILVVDDGSRHSPDAVVASAACLTPVFVHRLAHNGGPAAARNHGVALARGRFVAFLDADDLWFPDKLALQIADALARPDPDTVVAIAETWERWPDGDRLRPRWRPQDGALGDYFFLQSGVMQTSSLLVSTRLAKAHPFLETLRQFEDILFLLDLAAAQADFVFQDTKLFVWRRAHTGGQPSRRLHFASGAAFTEAAASRLGDRAAAAFEARQFGPALLQRAPFAFAAAAARALWLGAITPRGLAGVMKRSLSTEVY